MNRLILGFGVVLVVGTGLRADGPPREEQRAPDGRLLYAREPGEKPNSERVFDQGIWMTREYENGSRKVLRLVESPRERHEFRYDGSRVISHGVRVGDSEFTVTLEPNGFVQAKGLPGIQLRLDGDGNLSEILDEQGVLASFKYGASGKQMELSLGSRQRLVTKVEKGFARQTVHGDQGRVHYRGEFSLDASRGGVAPFNFDLVFADLGLPPNWGKGLRTEASPTGFSQAVRRGNESPVAWLVRGIPVGAALVDLVCRADGTPVAYEVTAAGMMDDVPAAPWRILVTPDRGISLYVPNGPLGSVISIWSRNGSFGYRVDARAPTSDGSRLYACGSSEVCTYSSTGGQCTVTQYYCFTDDALNALPDGWGGGGGGGTTSGSERMDGSPLSAAERPVVAAAEAKAFDQLMRKPACLALFADYGQPPQSGWGVRNMDKTYVFGALGSPHCRSSSDVASTPLGSTRTYLCPSFFGTRTAAERGTILIHEAVHTAGLGPDHAGLSSAAFQGLVASRCL